MPQSQGIIKKFMISMLHTFHSWCIANFCRLRDQELTAQKLEEEKKQISSTALHLQANLEVINKLSLACYSSTWVSLSLSLSLSLSHNTASIPGEGGY